MATISLRALRVSLSNDINVDGPVLVNQGTTNTYTITDYNSFCKYTVAATVGTPSISGATITLVVPTTAVPQITLTVTKTDAVGNATSAQFVIAVGATAIVTPQITSPAAGTANVSLSPTITGTAFSTAPAGATTHASSQWQISTNAGFTAIVYDSGVTTVNKTSIQVPANTLNLNTVYYVRVSYTGATIGTSAWSTVVSFTTTNVYIATPTLTVSDSVLATSETPTLIGSEFSVVNGSDVHSATDWQIVRISNGAVVWQSLGDTTNKMSIKVPAGVLLVSTQYRARVRYAGASLGYGGWAELNFTTATQFSYGQYLTVQGTGYRNGSRIVTNSRLLTFGKTLDAFTYIPNQPSEEDYRTPADGVFNSGSISVRGGLSYRPDGAYMIYSRDTGSGSVRSFTVYKREGDNFNRLPVPLTPDNYIANCAKWLKNDLLVTCTGNVVSLYMQQGDSFVKLSNTVANSPYGGGLSDSCYGSIAVHPSGNYFITTATSRGDVNSVNSYYILWKLSGTGINATISNLGSFGLGRVRFYGATWNPSGDRIILELGTYGALIRSFQNETFTTVSEISSVQYCTNAAYSPDGVYLALSDSGTVTVYKKIVNSENYTRIKLLQSGGYAYGDPAKTVKYTADGRRLIVVGNSQDDTTTTQRLLAYDATTEDYNLVPSFDVVMQGDTRLAIPYPAVPGAS